MNQSVKEQITQPFWILDSGLLFPHITLLEELMSFSFSNALSGLKASSASLDVTGNNIANSNTTGYKSNRINFADIFYGASANQERGLGVRVVGATANFTQGSLTDSASPTNMALSGNGFFVVQESNGARAYTRAGDFTIDKDGYLVTSTGARVQGFAAANGKIDAGTPLSDIKFPLGETVPPVMTTQATFRMNLNSADAANSTFHAPTQVYDSKGVAHTLDMAFTKQTDGSYQMSATLDGKPVNTSADGGAASANPVSFTFDANGQLTSPKSLSIVPDQTALNGATLGPVAIQLNQTNPDGTTGASNITNFALASAVSSTTQDGAPAGSLASFTTDRSGTIMGIFSNGQTRPIAQVAVATFNAQTELVHASNNLYHESSAAGSASIGAAGTGGRGEIVGNSLEQSNVDLASEFTDLIVAQRSFQANSRVITTISQTMQDLLQIS
jgi:flagellar hook protein FlgE